MKFSWFVAAMLLSSSTLARAAPSFATPPDYALPPEDDSSRPPEEPKGDAFDPRESDLRLCTGPVLRASRAHADGGFGAAIDIGRRAAGARFSGNWLRVGGDRGLAQYDAQLWLDFGDHERWHPIVAAGAGFAHVERADAQGALHDSTVGIGSLRGTLEYVLSIREADARAGIDLEGALPAITENASNVAGWVLISARVGVGF